MWVPAYDPAAPDNKPPPSKACWAATATAMLALEAIQSMLLALFLARPKVQSLRENPSSVRRRRSLYIRLGLARCSAGQDSPLFCCCNIGARGGLFPASRLTRAAVIKELSAHLPPEQAVPCQARRCSSCRRVETIAMRASSALGVWTMPPLPGAPDAFPLGDVLDLAIASPEPAAASLAPRRRL